MEGARGVAVATSDQAFAEAAARALSGIAHSGGAGALARIETADLQPPALAAIGVAAAIVIDAEMVSGETGRYFASSQGLEEVSRVFRVDHSEIGVTRILQALREHFVGRTPASVPVIVICADAPSDAFTQIALSCGADWVWPSRTSFKQLEEVVARLSSIKEHSLLNIKRPRIVVLENSPADINRLKGKLKDAFELSFVGVKKRAASKLSVSASEAWSHFEQCGPFSAAIVDLALSKEDEKQAALEVGSEESATENFINPNGQLSDRLQGIVFVKRLLDSGSAIPIVVMSNYVRVAVINRIKVELGALTENVVFLRKDFGGYRTLRALLLEKLSGTSR